MKRKQRDNTRFAIQKNSVLEYFKQNTNEWQKVLAFLRGEDGLTLRLLDHFVTSYSRKNVCETEQSVNVYHSMQSALRHGLNKKRLDPFNRKHCSETEKVTMEDGTVTNVGQLTFFRWAIVTGALEYVLKHKLEIRQDMAMINRQVQQQRKERRNNEAATGERSETNKLIREIVIDLPPEMTDDPSEKERYQITLTERLQKPKRKRKRIREDKVEALARVSDSITQPLVQVHGMKI